MRCLFQRDLHGVGEIGAAVDLLATRAAPGASARAAALLAEDVAEDVAEGFREAAKAFLAGAARAEAARVRIDPGMAVLVVGRPLLGVREHPRRLPCLP